MDAEAAAERERGDSGGKEAVSSDSMWPAHAAPAFRPTTVQFCFLASVIRKIVATKANMTRPSPPTAPRSLPWHRKYATMLTARVIKNNAPVEHGVTQRKSGDDATRGFWTRLASARINEMSNPMAMAHVNVNTSAANAHLACSPLSMKAFSSSTP